MIVIDSSAIVAIWEKEAQADEIAARILIEPLKARCLSTATYLEAGTVLAGRRIRDLRDWPAKFNVWIDQLEIVLLPVTSEQARIALDARIRYGRGFRSSAKLNFGDCFSYALAKNINAPLLYIGDDFDKTDIKSALPRKRKK